MKMRSIGFVDYNLNGYHANTFCKLLQTELAGRGWRVSRCWAMDEVTGREWAAKWGVPYTSHLGDMHDCDGIMVLAPSNPEVHLELARQILPLKIPTYIDKPFAPDLCTAREIFNFADQHHTPVTTTSALRFCRSLQSQCLQTPFKAVRHMQAWGGGASFEEYAIHPLEMIISIMGPEVTRVMKLGDGQHHQLQLEFSGNRTASAFVHTTGSCPFQAMITTEEATRFIDCSQDPIFQDLCSFVLDFFETRKEKRPA